MDTVLGLDIGHSAVKSASKNGTFVLPGGAGPVDSLPERVGRAEDVTLVTIDGTQWAAGIELTRLQGVTRPLHAGYAASDHYRALYYAALARLEQETIDILVTGLPVSQHVDKVQRAALAKRLSGRHQIAPRLSVEVRDVVVIAQPVGSWADAVQSTADTDFFESADVAVFDFGFYSVDFARIKAGDLHTQSSGSDTRAMSAILDLVRGQIMAEWGTAPSRDALETALRAGGKTTVRGTDVDLAPFLMDAAAKITPSVVDAIRAGMRQEGADPDAIILTGGGATLYEPAVRAAWPRTKVIIPDQPALANAKGFLAFARQA